MMEGCGQTGRCVGSRMENPFISWSHTDHIPLWEMELGAEKKNLPVSVCCGGISWLAPLVANRCTR